MDERHLTKMTAALAALTSIEGVGDGDRELADDIIRKSFETATVLNREVYIEKDRIRAEAKRIVDTIPDKGIMEWVGTDPLAEKRVEEFVRMRHGWDGNKFLALMRQCREFALIRIVYAALTTGKTVAVK